MSKPLKVSVASQKGGAGKTTITTLLANKLCFEYNKKVVVIDCNYPQLSIYGLRSLETQRFKTSFEKAKQGDIKIEKDLKLFLRTLEEYPNYSRDFNIITYPKDPKSTDNLAMENIIKILPQMDTFDCDIILFDSIGSANDPFLIHLLANNDYIFVPVEPETMAATSSVSFITSLNTVKDSTPDCPLKGIYALFNKVEYNTSLHKQLIKDVMIIAKKYNINMLTNKKKDIMFIEKKNLFQNDLVRSTVIPTFYHGKIFTDTACNKTLDEMIKIILSK